MKIATADTRRRALDAYEQGDKTQAEIAATFGITLRTFQRWWHDWRHDGRAAPIYSPGRSRAFQGETEEVLRRAVAQNPDATLEELAEHTGGIASYVTVHRMLNAWDLPLKKRRSGPQSRTDQI